MLNLAARTVGLLVAVALSCGVQATAAAQPAPTVAEAAEAKRHFEVGLKLYKERAFMEALAEFETSFKMGGRPSALKNAAQCRRDLKQFAEAYDAYERVLAHPTKLPAAELASVTQALEDLAVLTGTIAVHANVADAKIVVDGAPIGATPLGRPKRVRLGNHKVHASKAGFESVDRDVTVASEEAVVVELELGPEITTGRVVVREASGDETRLFVDGVDKGPLPWEGDLPAGEHVLEAKGPRHAAEKRTVQIARKERTEVVLDALATTGRLRVTVTPSSAAIFVDGVPHGTAVWEGELAPGSHRVEAEVEGFPRVAQQAGVVRGQLVGADLRVLEALDGASGPAFVGLEGRVDNYAAFAPGHGGYVPPNGAPSTVDKKGFGGPLALGGGLRIGHAFDWWALEGLANFQFVLQGAEYDLTEGSVLKLSNISLRGILGVAFRATSKTDTIRFTASAAVPALMVGGVFFTRAVSEQVLDFNESHVFVAPAFLFDAGILLGGAPGAQFFVGTQGWLEVAPTIVTDPDPVRSGAVGAFTDGPNGSWKATYGTVLYIGPTIGIAFGH